METRTVSRPPPVVAVVGPTASGKSTLGLALADRLGGEILCCDSMQVYKGMDIGTAKPTRAEQAAVPHHLFDLVEPRDHFHAAAWADSARGLIEDLRQRERLPILVGGTGLYFRALVRGLFEAPAPDAAIRARHQREASDRGVPSLHARLREIDPETAAKVLPGDLLRISRALEVYEQTGVPISELRRRDLARTPPLRLFSILLDFPLDDLRLRIRQRVDAMMTAGFLDEVRGLRAAGHGDARSMQALGYKQLGSHLDGQCSLSEAIEQTKLATVTYARRQRTWFRSEAITMRVHTPPSVAALARLVRGWLLL